eukprot:4266695-Amphidinium_carterae.1
MSLYTLPGLAYDLGQNAICTKLRHAHLRSELIGFWSKLCMRGFCMSEVLSMLVLLPVVTITKPYGGAVFAALVGSMALLLHFTSMLRGMEGDWTVLDDVSDLGE